MKTYRLNRLFNAQSNRCFDVAVDHGFFNEGGFLKGIEDIEAAVQTLAEQALQNAQVIGGDVFATVDAMRAANYRVDRDRDKQTPEAAAQWLAARVGLSSEE